MSPTFSRNETYLDGQEIHTVSGFCRSDSLNLGTLIAQAPRIMEEQKIPASRPWRLTELACSDGRETWSIAAGLAIQGIPFQISAYDINPIVVNCTRRRYDYNKTYLAEDLQRWGLPAECLDFFEQGGKYLKPNAKLLKQNIRFAVADARRDALAPADVVIANNFLKECYVENSPSLLQSIGNAATCLEPGGLFTTNDAHYASIEQTLAGNDLYPDPIFGRYNYPHFYQYQPVSPLQ